MHRTLLSHRAMFCVLLGLHPFGKYLHSGYHLQRHQYLHSVSKWFLSQFRKVSKLPHPAQQLHHLRRYHHIQLLLMLHWLLSRRRRHCLHCLYHWVCRLRQSFLLQGPKRWILPDPYPRGSKLRTIRSLYFPLRYLHG